MRSWDVPARSCSSFNDFWLSTYSVSRWWREVDRDDAEAGHNSSFNGGPFPFCQRLAREVCYINSIVLVVYYGRTVVPVDTARKFVGSPWMSVAVHLSDWPYGR